MKRRILRQTTLYDYPEFKEIAEQYDRLMKNYHKKRIIVLLRM